ncbi:Ger(x)C family spore germination protein [Paenibacillus sp. GCM10027626]|uniref:Ger(x)C family spore germination protein n=1 Tax=Paenibacillus sp. GCM10027626 TaxID=3273411 RepID=UPI003641BB82
MQPKGLVLLLLCSIIVLLTGCWSRHELNELSITLGLGIDKKGDRYFVSAQVVDPSQAAAKSMGGTNRVPVTLYRSTGKSVSEALRKMTTVAPRTIYLAHLRIVIFGEELARSGIGDALDFLSRDNETRTDFYFAIARDTSAEKILSILTPLEKIPANNLYSSLQTSANYWAPTHGLFLDELLNGLAARGKSPAITGVRILGQNKENEEEEQNSTSIVNKIKPPIELSYEGIGVLHGDRLIGWLSSDESKGYNYIQGHVKQTLGHIECEDGGRLASDVVRAHTNLTSKIINGAPEIFIHISAEGNIKEVACHVNLNDPATIPKLNKQVNAVMANLVQKAVNAAQHKFKTDFLGFGDSLRKKQPSAWAKMEKDWEKLFESVPVHIDVDYRLRRIGTITNPLQESVKE